MSKYIQYFDDFDQAQGYEITAAPFSCYIRAGQSALFSQYYGRIEQGGVSNNQCIFYTTNNNSIIDPYDSTYLPTQLVNEYINGRGVMCFDQDVIKIVSRMFWFEGHLTSVIIPNSVEIIEGLAFYKCSSLPSIIIPSNVSTIQIRALYGSSAMKAMVVDSSNKFYDSRENCNAIIETTSNTLISGCQNTIIPNSVTMIGDWAFGGCSSLSSITIPNSVTSIGISAFEGCSSLTSITIPNSVTSIGDDAFGDCSSLVSITCEATTPPTLGSNNNRSSVTSVYVPAESVDLYKNATNWSYYSGVIKPIE